jgi:hypothetical protein
VSLVWPLLITAAAVAVVVGLLLAVRRGAPDGGYFTSGDRAAGMFGVLASGFAILLGFVVFLAFESFDSSRQGAEAEATIVAQQFETAQFFPVADRGDLSNQLICYGRSVVGQEWPQMAKGNADLLNPWGVALFRTLQRVDPQTPVEQAAFSKWLDQTTDREQARTDRIHGAEGVMPNAVWVAMFFMAAVILVFMLFFADRGERRVVQAVQVGSVVAVIAASLFVIRFLNSPFETGAGGLRPVAMTRTLQTLAQARTILGSVAPLPCDLQGKPLTPA